MLNLDIMDINAPTSRLAISTTQAAQSIPLSQDNKNILILYNAGASPVAVETSKGAITLAYPAAGAEFTGSIIPPGNKEPYSKAFGHDTLTAIMPSGAAASDLYIQIGLGK